MNFDTKRVKTIFLSIGILLFVLSLIAHQFENWDIYRGLRGIISFVGIALLLYFQGKRAPKKLLLFLLLYGSSSIVTIWYESQDFAVAAMALNAFSFLVLLMFIYPLVYFRRLDRFMLLVFVIMVCVIGYLMYEFVAMMQSFSTSSLHYAFILLSAMVGVLTSFFALLYNHNYASRASLAFTLFFFLLLFAEVFRGIGYYDFAFGDVAVFIARILLIVATFLLVKYSLLLAANK